MNVCRTINEFIQPASSCSLVVPSIRSEFPCEALHSRRAATAAAAVAAHVRPRNPSFTRDSKVGRVAFLFVGMTSG